MKTSAPQTRIYFSFGAFANTLMEWKQQGESIVFTNGCFDILHKGHIDYLYKCAVMADHLIIGLNTDHSIRGLKGTDRPIINEDARAFVLASIGCVDAVVLFNDPSPLSLIEKVGPDIIIKGADYNTDNMDGASFVKSYGGQVITIPLTEEYSTTAIINKIRQS